MLLLLLTLVEREEKKSREDSDILCSREGDCFIGFSDCLTGRVG